MVTFSRSTFQKIVQNFKTNAKNAKKPGCHDINKPKEAQNEQQSTHVITRLDKDDYNQCINLMWSTYFKDEPICRRLGVRRNVVLNEYIRKSLSFGHSFVAKHSESGEIIGACINEIVCPWASEELDYLACSAKSRPVRDLLKFWAFIQRSPKLDYKPIVFELGHLFVSRKGRKKGIGVDLARRSIESGADCGFSLIRMDATGYRSSQIAQKLGMNLIYEIPYCHYLNHNGMPVVKPKGKNKSVKIYIIRPCEMKGNI